LDRRDFDLLPISHWQGMSGKQFPHHAWVWLGWEPAIFQLKKTLGFSDGEEQSLFGHFSVRDIGCVESPAVKQHITGRNRSDRNTGGQSA
jgi:hypothetical protein